MQNNRTVCTKNWFVRVLIQTVLLLCIGWCWLVCKQSELSNPKNGDKPRNVRRKTSRCLREENILKIKEPSSEQTARWGALATCTEKHTHLSRVTNLGLIWWRMRTVIWLQIPTVFLTGARSPSVCYWMQMGLTLLRTLTCIQLNH
jgi:hypothetical protein